MSLSRILVVDDEPDVRKSVRLTLTRAGYEVVEAEDGEQAIQVMKFGDNPLLVDTIICDLNMPTVKGMEAIAYFRSQFPSVPVIVLTGQSDIQAARSVFKQGVVDYLVKPIGPDQLTALVPKPTRSTSYLKTSVRPRAYDVQGSTVTNPEAASRDIQVRRWAKGTMLDETR